MNDFVGIWAWKLNIRNLSKILYSRRNRKFIISNIYNASNNDCEN